MAKATTTRTRPLTIPKLTLEQARVLLCWWEKSQDDKRQGRGNDDDLLDWGQMMDHIQFTFGFAAWDAATTLREMPEALLGRWDLPHGMSELHHLHPFLRLNPTLIYEVLNRAEEAAKMELTPNPYAKPAKRVEAETPAEPKPEPAARTRTAVVKPLVKPASKGRVIRAPKGKAKTGLGRAAQAAKATRKAKVQPKHEA